MVELVYLDSCVLNRPTDDQAQERVHLETLAIANVLDEVVSRTVE